VKPHRLDGKVTLQILLAVDVAKIRPARIPSICNGATSKVKCLTVRLLLNQSLPARTASAPGGPKVRTASTSGLDSNFSQRRGAGVGVTARDPQPFDPHPAASQALRKPCHRRYANVFEQIVIDAENGAWPHLGDQILSRQLAGVPSSPPM